MKGLINIEKVNGIWGKLEGFSLYPAILRTGSCSYCTSELLHIFQRYLLLCNKKCQALARWGQFPRVVHPRQKAMLFTGFPCRTLMLTTLSLLNEGMSQRHLLQHRTFPVSSAWDGAHLSESAKNSRYSLANPQDAWAMISMRTLRDPSDTACIEQNQLFEH